MAVSFACPECGTPIELAPTVPGRQARCAECLTLVEVPFLPRATSRSRRGHARQWLWVAIAVSVAIAASCAVYLVVTNNLRAERRRVFTALLAEAQADAERNDWSNALRRADAALDLAASGDGIHPAALAEARDSRQQWSLHLAQQRASDQERLAESSLAVARASLADARPDLNRALDACEAAIAAAAQLDSAARGPLEAEARALAASAVCARGVRFLPVRGTYLTDELAEQAAAYEFALRPPLARALDAHGFIARRDNSTLANLWDQTAPYQFEMEIKESLGPTYLNSPLRTTRIDAKFWLRASSREVWKAGLTAHTRVPSSRFSAFESGYLAAATRRDPKLEKRLRDDAFEAALGMLPAKLATMPDWTPLASPGQP
jgi:hypothetical protein